MNAFKKVLMASAVAASFGAVNAQATTIQFDMNGAAAGGVIAVDTFDWAPDNALVINGANPLAGAAGPLQVLAQGSLASFIKSGAPASFTAPVSGTEYTFQIDMLETATGIGTASTNLNPVSGTFKVFYDAVANANQLAGTGYGDGLKILEGKIVAGPGSTGTFTDLTLLNPGLFPVTALDKHNANDYPNVASDQGSGNTNLEFLISYANPAFFLTNLTNNVISFALDSSNNTTPFIQADPAALVGGVAPVFTNLGPGQYVNGQPGLCYNNIMQGTQQSRCDFLIQTDAATTFLVPEPGSMALFGLGIGALGLAARRRRAA